MANAGHLDALRAAYHNSPVVLNVVANHKQNSVFYTNWGN